MRIAAGSRRWQAGVAVSAPPSGTDLSPGAAWNGTAGSGGSAPAESATVLGSGFTDKAIGNFDEPYFAYLTADLSITVMVDTADTAWIKEVMFYLEGNTLTIPAAQQTLSARTGAVGYSCNLKFSQFAQDGDASLYAYIRPINGFERRIGPLALCAVGTGVSPITRPLRYLDPAGNDSWNGTSPTFVSGTTGPWKTPNAALRLTPSSGIVQCAIGTYLEDVATNSPVNSPARPIEFRRAPGLNLGDVVFSRTTRGTPEFNWHLYCTQAIFNGIQIDTDALPNVLGRSSGLYIWQNCSLLNPAGPNGPLPNGYNYSEIQQTFLSQTIGGPGKKAYHALCETTFSNPPVTGWTFARGSTLNTSWDAVFIDNGTGVPGVSSGMVCLNTTLNKTGFLEQREHIEVQLTVSSVTFDAINNRTTIAWTGTPTLANLPAVQSDTTLRIRFFTGAMGATEPQVYSQDPVGRTTTVYGGSITAVAGDTAKVYQKSHSDSGQLAIMNQSDANLDNFIFQRMLTQSILGDTDGFQPIFLQAGTFTGAGTVSTVGVSGTCSTNHLLKVNDFVAINAGPQLGQYQQVLSVDSPTTFTLKGAFTVDQTARAWKQTKSINNVSYQLCAFTSPRVPPSNNAQWQHGEGHVVMRQTTFDAGDFNPRSDVVGFGANGNLFQDSIIFSMTHSPWPTVGINLDNNHFGVAPAHGTNTEVGTVTYDVTWKPTAGVALTIASPKLKYDLYGQSLFNDGTDLVGAVKR